MHIDDNLQYFHGKSMGELYQKMKDWEVEWEKSILSINIQQEGHLFTCIALTNPIKVVLCNDVGEEMRSDWSKTHQYPELVVKISKDQ